MNFPIKYSFPRDDASRRPPESSPSAATTQIHTVSPTSGDAPVWLTRSPSIKILQRPESEQELRQNHNEAVADYKERIMYERVMRGRSPAAAARKQFVLTGSSTISSTSGATVTTTVPTTTAESSARTLLSPQGYLIPVVSVPAESHRGEEEEDEDEGIFDLEL